MKSIETEEGNPSANNNDDGGGRKRLAMSLLAIG